jgi:hypothetical protein
LQWIYNLRISYPDQEIYPGDDDVSGAYRHMKYHPNLVAMHTFIPLDYMAVATGATFGDCTSPSNWDPIAQARQQMARHLWSESDIVHRAAPFLPHINISKAPGKEIRDSLTRADADSKNCGIFRADGSRMLPPFAHHVDDNMYADVAEHLTRTISASVISLYEVLGYPSKVAPSTLQFKKFNTEFTHKQKAIGRIVVTRKLEVTLVPEKRDQVVNLLTEWLTKQDSCGQRL